MNKIDKAEAKEWLTDNTSITTLYLNAKPFDPNCFLSKNLLNESLLALWSKFVEFDNNWTRETIKENIQWNVPQLDNSLLQDKQEKIIKKRDKKTTRKSSEDTELTTVSIEAVLTKVTERVSKWVKIYKYLKIICIRRNFFNIELISKYSKWLIQCSLSTPIIWSIDEFFWLMGEHMKDNIFKIWRKDMVFSNGQMVEDMRDSGNKENSKGAY